MKNRSRKRTLAFERLETKATPAALLVALAPLDDATHERVEQAVPDATGAIHAVDTSSNWQFCHSVVTLLQFVDECTLPGAPDLAVCSPPTWDQCQTADEMMKLHDHELRTLVMADQLDTPTDTLGD
jgi:hypothetical protein